MANIDKTRFQVAVVGAGYWGRNLVRNFHQLGALGAIVDSSPDTLNKLGELYPQANLTSRLERVLGDDSIQALAIATPAASHAETVEAALEAGKHVFVEKPLCLHLSQGNRLVQKAASKNLTLMVGHLLHYHPAVMELKRLVDQGRLGKILYIHSDRLNLGKVRSEENILWSFAPHDISLILALTGQMPQSVTASGAHYLQAQVDDVTISTMSFPSGVRANIHVNWLYPFKEQRLVVVGDAGMAVFNDVEPRDKLLIYPHRIKWQHQQPVPEKVEPYKVPFEPGEPLCNECEHFLNAMATGLPPMTDGREGLRVLAVLEACQRSLAAGGGVERLERSQEGPEAPAYSAHPSAVVDPGCEVGAGTRIWHFAHVIKGSRIGRNCSLGQNVMVGPGVMVGDGVKIQNNVSVYQGVTLQDHVFCGPSVVFTNVYNPRAELSRMDELRPTLVKTGATLGANSTVVCGVTIGRYAFVGAGALVNRDVMDYALVVGNPAAPIGWVCSCGVRLDFMDQKAKCQACGAEYHMHEGRVMRTSE